MSIKENGYAAFWALSGLARPFTTAAFLREKRAIDQAWEQSEPRMLADLGSARSLSILPLIDYYGTREELAGEPGVSYLVTIDGYRILFDVGRNVGEKHPSPLLRNMRTIGISVADLDAIFISHLHLDHVGGIDCQRRRTFALSALPVDLGGVPAYTPAPMTHPSARVETITAPRKLREGVASSGPLLCALWFMGTTAEQSLLVNVESKGLVMIAGCGHPSMSRLILQAEAVTGARLYAVVGGLHFPVTGSRVGKGGQNILGNGKLPWQRISRREARQAAAELASRDLGLVALSAHDSCDWTLGTFEELLGSRYRTVVVGEEIVVA